KKKVNEEDKNEMKNELNTTKNNKSNTGLLTKATDGLAIRNVVQRLRSHKDFLHIYLDTLFLHNHHAGYEFHNEQVELYAEYNYPRLIDFLCSSNYYSPEEAFKICEQRDLVPEMVYILGRLGNNKKDFMLIIERLQRFIIGLLENLGGTSIYPIRLEILGLKDALIKVLQDFNLQCSMANQLHKAQKRGISIEGY
ncbi:9738_t:CDS:2, partial [Entrophospora sp. SA101]